jgi:DNA (cytosine-5)-methyltransferase 1
MKGRGTIGWDDSGVAKPVKTQVDGQMVCFGGNNTAGPIDVATARNASASASGRLDFESETFVAFSCKDHGADAGKVSPTLRSMGHAGSHPNAGGQVAIAFHPNAQAAQLPTTTTDTSKTAARTCSQGAAVAQCATGDVFHTLRAEGFDASEDGTGRGGGAVAVALRGREGGAACELGDEVGFTLRASSGGGDKPHVLCPTVAQPVRTNPRNNSDGGMEARQRIYGGAQVRRLTPTECEKLQNFPTGYTKIPWRGKPAELCPDGPRYKALGNSMCTAVIFWIGQSIEHAAKSSTKGKAK